MEAVAQHEGSNEFQALKRHSYYMDQGVQTEISILLNGYFYIIKTLKIE